MRKIVMTFFIAMLLLYLFEIANAQTAAKYLRAISGDTFIVEMGDEQIVVRLYGIDAPDIGHLYHDKPTRHLDNIMSKSKTYVIMHRVGKEPRDKFGRYQAVVYKDGTCVNKSMIEDGMAFVYKDECKIDKCPEWTAIENKLKDRKDNVEFLGEDKKPWELRKDSLHLAGSKQGYYEDIFFIREGKDVVAYDTTIPDAKVYAPPPPEVVYIPYATNSTVIYNVNQNQVNVRR